jgi:hypothetical protein
MGPARKLGRRLPATSTNDNAHYSFVREGTALVIRRDIGSLKDDNTMIAASVTAAGEIELVTEYKAFSHVMTSRYARDGADRFRAQSNKDEKNVYAIRDGKSTRTGSTVPAMSRCVKAD